MTKKKKHKIKSDYTTTTQSFTELYGEGAYTSETITKGEYDRREKRRKTFFHKEDGERVW